MKRYEVQETLSYHVQDHMGSNLTEIFNSMLHKMGGQLMEQVYNDFPEFFSQENQPDFMQTIYKAEIFITTREDMYLLNSLLQRRR